MSFVSFIPCIIMVTLLLLRVPVAFALIVPTAIYYTFINTTMPIEVVVQSMSASMESFPYLAIPFFTCAGVVFNFSGITDRLYALTNLLVGHLRGGLAQVNVLMSALMGGLSGSASADAAMDSKTVVPQMLKQGYSKGFATVVTAAKLRGHPDHPARHHPHSLFADGGCLRRPHVPRRLRSGHHADHRPDADGALDRQQARLCAGARQQGDGAGNLAAGQAFLLGAAAAGVPAGRHALRRFHLDRSRRDGRALRHLCRLR
jgi:hypothetical protein